jgi:uncharacterized protein (TIGR03437 family)
MDAAQLRLKNFALFLPLLLAAGANAQSFTLSSTAVTVSLSQPATVTVDSTGAAISFTATVANNTPTDPTFICVENQQSVSATTPTALHISLCGQAGLIYSGTHSATVSLTATDGSNATARITVSYTAGAGGVGSGTGLTCSPNPLAATVQAGAQTTVAFSLTNSTGNPIGFTIEQPTVGWFSVTPSSGTVNPSSSANLVASFDATNVGASSQTSMIVDYNGTQLVVPVSLTIGTGGGGSTGTLQLSQTSTQWTYSTGGSVPQSASIAASSSAGQITYTAIAASSNYWLLVNGSTSATGTLPATLNITPTANLPSLQTGNYAGTVTVAGSDGSVAYFTVNLTVNGGAAGLLTVSPNQVAINAPVGGAAVSTTVTVTSAVGGSLTAVVTGPGLSLPSPPANLQANTATNITLVADPTALAASIYGGALTVSVGGVTQSVQVLLTVGSAAGTGNLSLSSTSLTFQAPANGTAPINQVVYVTAPTTTTFTVSTNETSCTSANWLSVTPFGTTTTNQTLSVSVNQQGIPGGTTCTGNVVLIANGVTQNVSVTMNVTGPTGGNVTVTANGGTTSPPSLTFTAVPGGGNPASQYLTITSAGGAAGVPFTAAATVQSPSGGTWLQLDATSATTPLNKLDVSVNTTGLAPGSYSGTITITPTGGNAVSVQVTLTIQAPTVSAAPTSLSFGYTAGGQPPASQTIQVTATNGTGLGFTATAASNGNWLSVTPTSGTTPTNPAGPATLTVSVDPTSLNAGQVYNGTITVAGTNGATGTTTINVSVTVSAPLPTVTTVVNAATFQAGPVAPGEIVSIGGTALGPATPAGLQLTPSGSVATTLGGVQVLFNGVPAPLTYASSTQINAVVPYEVAGILAPTVFVKFLGQTSNGFSLTRTTTSPGIFTQNSQGTGPGAILNPDYSVNGPNNPAAKGSVVSVYMTGEGQTSPAGVTGKVTNVTSVSQIPVPLLPIAVLINNQPANYTFAGEAPGFVSGVLQLNVQIPSNAPSGNLPIVVSIGGNSSQNGVTVSVK